MYSMETFYSKHLDNIIDLKEFCDSKNIPTLMYFGWSNFFTHILKEYPILINKINQIPKSLLK